MLNRYLVKRFITVEEVADLVAFLFGPSAYGFLDAWCEEEGIVLTVRQQSAGHGG